MSFSNATLKSSGNLSKAFSNGFVKNKLAFIPLSNMLLAIKNPIVL